MFSVAPSTMSSSSKCFTHVTKICANLTTYSRKPENYNGTIIFEIDIMKNSSPISLNLCQTWIFHKCFGCYCFWKFQLFSAEHKMSHTEENCYFGFDSGKTVNFKLSWEDFFMVCINLKNNCNCNSSVFYYMWLSWWHTWKIYPWVIFQQT